MSLTLGGGPLAADAPTTVNYRVDGPIQLLFAHSFPRRVRVVLADTVVLDTDRGLLVHAHLRDPFHRVDARHSSMIVQTSPVTSVSCTTS